MTSACGVDPIHVAVIMTVGTLPGPLVPMFIALTLTHAVVTFVPQLSTALVRWLGVSG